MAHCKRCPNERESSLGLHPDLHCPGCGHEAEIARLHKEVQHRLDEQNFLQHRLNESLKERDALRADLRVVAGTLRANTCMRECCADNPHIIYNKKVLALPGVQAVLQNTP